MTLLFAMLPLMLGAATVPPDGGVAPDMVSVDGGEVPNGVPSKKTDSAANVLAPELVSDSRSSPDGGLPLVVAPRSLSVYDVNIPAETAITAGFFGLYIMVDVLVRPTLSSKPACLNVSPEGRCNPADLSAFDRYAVGRSSKEWSVFSDIALATSVIVPALYLGLESLVLPTDSPWGDFLGDALVITEALALTSTVQTVLKYTFRRPRPANYLSKDVAPDIDLQLSLPSGHTSMVAAATTALTTTIFLRHPDSKVRYFVLAAGVAVSLLTGFARVEAGVHFPTDVITGLLIGGAAGFAVPFLHKKFARITPSLAFDPTTGTTILGVSGSL